MAAITIHRTGLGLASKTWIASPSVAAALIRSASRVTPLITRSAALQLRFQSNESKARFISAAEGQQILASRRLQRPVSPHLGIYKWQIGSVMSSLMRITGVAYGGSFFLFGIAYLVSPHLGWNLSSAAMADAAASLPVAANMALRFVIAWPFVLHCINGTRHLTWDTARGFNSKFIHGTGWLAVSATTLSVAYMVFSWS